MLGGDRDDAVTPPLSRATEDATKSEVARFGRPRSENDFVVVGIDEFGNLSAGISDGGGGVPAKTMTARVRVAELLGEVGPHGRSNRWVHRRRGLVVEIDWSGRHSVKSHGSIVPANGPISVSSCKFS